MQSRSPACECGGAYSPPSTASSNAPRPRRSCGGRNLAALSGGWNPEACALAQPYVPSFQRPSPVIPAEAGIQRRSPGAAPASSFLRRQEPRSPSPRSGVRRSVVCHAERSRGISRATLSDAVTAVPLPRHSSAGWNPETCAWRSPGVIVPAEAGTSQPCPRSGVRRGVVCHAERSRGISRATLSDAVMAAPLLRRSSAGVNPVVLSFQSGPLCAIVGHFTPATRPAEGRPTSDAPSSPTSVRDPSMFAKGADVTLAWSRSRRSA